MSFRARQMSRRALPPDFGGFNPKNIGAGTLALWLRSDLGITLNGSDVSAWADQSGSGNDLSQGNAAQQPLFVASAQNSRPCVRFTAATSDTLVRAATNLFAAGPYSLYVVLKLNAAGATAYFAVDGNPSTSGMFINNGSGRNINHTNILTHVDGAVQTASPEIWSIRYQAGSGPVFALTGVSTAVTNPSGSGLLDPGGGAAISLASRAVGSADFTDMDSYEVIGYRAFLSASDDAHMTTYLRTRYAL